MPATPSKSAAAPLVDSAATLSTFVALMTAFGGTQQLLKTRMQDDAEQGLGPLHMRALCLCQRNPGGSQQQLVQSLLRDKGQIARLIRELEERGLLVRTPDERDRRVWCLTVTPEGEEKCAWFSALEARVAHDLLGTLSATDTTRLNKVLQTVQAQLDQLGRDV
jgi:DNA-binding MarR family transcriptional regulator